MAESSGGTNTLAFIVGILVVAVAALAILYFTGVFGGGSTKIDVNLPADKKGSIERPITPPMSPALSYG